MTNIIKKTLAMLIIATLIMAISTVSLATVMSGTIANFTFDDDIPNFVFEDVLDNVVESEDTQELSVESLELDIPSETPMPAAIAGTYTWPTLQSGSSGANVYALQCLLNFWGHGPTLTTDGIFGANTVTAVKNLQKAKGLSQDGIVGANTWTSLTSVTVTVSSYSSNAAKAVQYLLRNKFSMSSVTVSSVFDTATKDAVSVFQKHFGLTQNGTVNANTWNNLIGASPQIVITGNPIVSKVTPSQTSGSTSTQFTFTATANTDTQKVVFYIYDESDVRVFKGDRSEFTTSGSNRLFTTDKVPFSSPGKKTVYVYPYDSNGNEIRTAGKYATTTVTVASPTYTTTVNGSYASTSGAGNYTEGATVSISAGTRSGYAFSGWTTSTSGVTFANSSNATTTFKMPARNATVTANWAQTSTYTFSISPNTDYTFPTLAAGYTVPTARTVTVNNTGNQSGTFSISTSSSNFTVSKTTTGTLSGGANTTFTVAPKSNLTVGTYTSTITVNGGTNFGSKSFSVSFAVTSASTYSFSLSPNTDYTFPTSVVGYTVPTARTVTVNNTGNQSGTFSISTSNSNFTVSKTTTGALAGGSSTTFTVVPQSSLKAGTYTSTITVNGGTNFGSKSFSVSFTVNPTTGLVTITWDTDGGTLASLNQQLASGTQFGTLSFTPVRSGCTFGGWWTQRNGKGIQITSSSTVPQVNTTYYAKWTVTITWNASGGSVSPNSETKIVGDGFGTLPTPVKSRCKFDGWWTKVGGTGTKLSMIMLVLPGNATYYAKWLDYDLSGNEQTLANKVLNLHWAGKITLKDYHDAESRIGDDAKDEATAYHNVLSIANGRQAYLSDYNDTDGTKGGTTWSRINGNIPAEKTTDINIRILMTILVMAYEYGNITVNEIAGGGHVNKSQHYLGRAVDIAYNTNGTRLFGYSDIYPILNHADVRNGWPLNTINYSWGVHIDYKAPEMVSSAGMIQTIAMSYEIVESSNPSWLHVDSNAQPIGDIHENAIRSNDDDKTFTIIVDPNTSPQERTGTVTVINGDETEMIGINQDGSSGNIELSTIVVSYPVSGAESMISVTSNVSWQASSPADWLHIFPDAGFGEGEFTIHADENTLKLARTATITIDGGGISKTISVTQEKFAVILELSDNSIDAQGAGDKLSIDVDCNTEWVVSSSNNDWITLINDSGSGNGSFTIKVDPNKTSATRNAVITVETAYGNGEDQKRYIWFNQGCMEIVDPEIELLPNDVSALGSGGSFTIDTRCNTSWKVTPGVSWITVDSNTGSGNNDFTITVAPNTTAVERKAIITVDTTAAELIEGCNNKQAFILVTQDAYVPPDNIPLYIKEATGNIGTIGRVVFDIPDDPDFLEKNTLVCDEDIDVEIYYSPTRTENAITGGQNICVFAVRLPNGETKEDISFSIKPVGGDIEKNKIIIYGDVNEDGNVTTTDATMITRWAGGNTSIVLKNILAGDINGDGSITTTDATLLTRRAGGNISAIFSIETRF